MFLAAARLGASKNLAPGASDRAPAALCSQRTRYPSIKEHTSNHRGLNSMIYKVYSLIKGYWVLGVAHFGLKV